MMLILVRGLPGSGKSTLAQKQFGFYKHLEADMYFNMDGEYKFDASQLGAAHGWCKDQTRKYLSMNRDVIVTNTFTQAWELADYLKIAKDFGITAQVIEMQTQYQNIHGVPEEAITRMRNRWHDEARLRENLSEHVFGYRVEK